MPEAPSSSGRRDPIWAAAAWIALVLYSLNLITIMLWRPIWLAPPNTANTGTLNVALLLIWVVLLALALAITLPRGWVFIGVAIVLAVVIALTILTLVGPSAIAIWASTTVNGCVTEDLGAGVQLSTCQTYFAGSLVFEGRQGLPIMWLVGHQ
jgi:hypothetical protein